jgi:hypothetical protein
VVVAGAIYDKFGELVMGEA